MASVGVRSARRATTTTIASYWNERAPSYVIANAAPVLRVRHHVVGAGGQCGVAEAIRRWRSSRESGRVAPPPRTPWALGG